VSNPIIVKIFGEKMSRYKVVVGILVLVAIVALVVWFLRFGAKVSG